jgi:hypothetical protein
LEEKNQSSMLGTKIVKTGTILRNTALTHINEYQERFSKINDFYEHLFKNLIVNGFDKDRAFKTIRRLFGKDTLNFVAIDGTEYSKPLFDMIIFYAGAYSCEGTIDVSNQDKAIIKYKNKFLAHSNDFSSCIPVYIDKIPEIDQTFHNEEGKVNLMKYLTEETIINNTNVANFLMTFSEFYLAYQNARSGNCDLIMMDRNLSNMYSSLMYDTSNRNEWSTNSSFIGYNTKYDEEQNYPIDINDITIARHLIINDKLDLPCPRGDYLRHAIFNLLSNHRNNDDGLEIDKILLLLKINDNEGKIRTRIKKYINKSIEEGIIVKEKNKGYKLAEKYLTTSTRIKKAVNEIAYKIFNDDKEPFILSKDSGKKEWITTLDLSFLTLFTFYMLIEECWKNNVLLIGITKDTTAQEFKNHVIPICLNNKIWLTDQEKLLQESFDKLPATDRMLLQSLSILNYDKINLPWGLVEYDSAFVMAIPDFKKREGYVSGAMKNKITPNQLFLRSFIQLEHSQQDKRVRSNVLAIDRLVYPDFDLASNGNVIEFNHDYNGLEIIKFLLFKNNGHINEIQNLLLFLLKSMSCGNIGETFGYNRALFVADKVAKWHNGQFRNIVDSTSHLMSCNKNMKNFVYYMNTFRERRETFESNRRL